MAGGTPATALLTRHGVVHRLHAYEHDSQHNVRGHDARPDYGTEASAALGVEPARLFKTLIASVDGTLVCAVVPVAGRLDLKALARAVGGKRAAMAEPAAAERATGYVVGGISPLAQRTRLPVVLDRSATRFETVYVSAGRRGLQVELAPADLVRISGASTADVATVDGADRCGPITGRAGDAAAPGGTG